MTALFITFSVRLSFGLCAIDKGGGGGRFQAFLRSRNENDMDNKNFHPMISIKFLLSVLALSSRL